jgi:hypothetical protein
MYVFTDFIITCFSLFVDANVNTNLIPNTKPLKKSENILKKFYKIIQ